MKKRIWHLSRRVVVCTVFLFVQQFIQSQVSNPSTWESFVQSNANISIRDTFRMQTFEGLASDNWDYACLLYTLQVKPLLKISPA